MKKPIILVPLLLWAGLVLGVACAPSAPAPPAVAPAAPALKEKQGGGRAAWQARWETVLEGAKKEGKIMVYGISGDLRVEVIKKFPRQYGIEIEWVGAPGPDTAARIMSERRAGLFIPDVILGASLPGITMLKPAGYLDPLEPVLILPEVTDPKAWWKNRFPWVDKDRHMASFSLIVRHPFIINTKMVRPDEVKSLRNLIEPRWKDKIIMHDPSIAGSGFDFVTIQAKNMGIDYLRQLARQEPTITRDQRLLSEWVAKEKFPIGIAPGLPAEALITAGAPIQWITTTEGTSVTGALGYVSLPKNAPHPNASTVFINWFLGKEGQAVFSEATNMQSARQDVPINLVNPDLLRKPGVDYFEAYTEEFFLRQPEDQKLAKDIFGHLLAK